VKSLFETQRVPTALVGVKARNPVESRARKKRVGLGLAVPGLDHQATDAHGVGVLLEMPHQLATDTAATKSIDDVDVGDFRRIPVERPEAAAADRLASEPGDQEDHMRPIVSSALGFRMISGFPVTLDEIGAMLLQKLNGFLTRGGFGGYMQHVKLTGRVLQRTLDLACLRRNTAKTVPKFLAECNSMKF